MTVKETVNIPKKKNLRELESFQSLRVRQAGFFTSKIRVRLPVEEPLGRWEANLLLVSS